MHLPRNLLDRPAEETARLIALAFLDQAVAARKRLPSTDPESLHDFRVGVRRLRTCLRVFRRELADGVSDETRERLASLGRATRDSRDLEVHREWALSQEGRLNPRQRVAIAWLVDRIDRRKKVADRRLALAVDHHFATTRRRLRRELRQYRLTVRVDRIAAGHSAAPAVGRQIQVLAGDVEGRLSSIHSMAQRDVAHEARIRVKRLRYILEPIQGQVEEVAPVVSRLKLLQDLLGDLQDAQVFSAELDDARKAAKQEQFRRLTRSGKRWRTNPGLRNSAADTDPRPGLVALSRQLAVRSEIAFRRLESEWLGGAAEEFFGQVHELADSLIHGFDDSREIERKYLLRSIPPAARVAPALQIEQGWLPGTRIAERVRRVKSGVEERRFRTIKAGTGISRLEVEEEMPGPLFDRLWPLTEGRRVVKRRHKVNDHGLTWEIDEFADRDLVLAEVELPSEDTPVEPPEWLKPYVVREVTGEDAFVNLNLAR